MESLNPLQSSATELEKERRKNSIIRQLSLELNKPSGLKEKLDNILMVLDQEFGLKHTMLLLPDEGHQQLKVFASRGFEEKGIGAQINFGEGVIGVVALRKRKLRMNFISRQRLYLNISTGTQLEKSETSMPGLADVESQVAFPLLVNDVLTAVLSAESTDISFFSPEDEDFLMTLSQIIALSIQNAIIMEQLEKKVQERTRALELQKKELERVNASKDRLFTIIGHDLRSPAASLQQVAELIRYYSKKGMAQQLADTGDKIVNVTRNLSSMLDNLLNWSIAQTGDLQIKPEKICLSHLIREVAELYGDMATSKNIRLHIADPEHLFIWADKNAAFTILRNLLSNAIKFTASGGNVYIQVSCHTDTAEIRVSDEGVGMAPEHLTGLFDIKEHQSTKGTAKEKGTGLGLLLVQEMVRLSKGQLSLSSQQGQGTTVVFTLPLYR